MRTDEVGSVLKQANRAPRSVIALMYDVGSIYLTSHTGIADVPGTVVEGCLEDISSASQQLRIEDRRTSIGGLSFTVVDRGSDLTEALRDQLFSELQGPRLRQIRLWCGDTADFGDGTWTRVGTYLLDRAIEVSPLAYRFTCSDVQRETRERIFEFKRTRLAQTLNVDDSTVVVQSTAEFQLVQHTAAFTESPLLLVGYLRIKKTGEIIRYTGKDATTFTGCTRQIGATVADLVEVNIDEDPDRWPEVEEFIYLEMPAPQMLYALLTGTILGSAYTLPAHWHLGIDAAEYIDTASFTNIGTDLFDPNDDDAGLVLRFLHRKSVQGKSFIEEQLLTPMWCYLHVTAYGKLQLRRITASLADAGSIRTLTMGRDLVEGELSMSHELGEVVNHIEIRWNWDGEEFTRRDIFSNQGSIDVYGQAAKITLSLEGLTVQRHTSRVMRNLVDAYTDRFGSPPIRLRVTASSRHNDLEVGDVIRVQIPALQDYTGTSSLDRTFEVLSAEMNWMTGELSLDLFGSSAQTLPETPVGDINPLDDSWYTSEGANVTSALTVVAGHVTANGTLTGNADLRSGVYYYPGNLTIDSGVTVGLTQNVQLRVLGSLTINGTIGQAGGGIAAVSDPNVNGTAYTDGGLDPVATTFGSTAGSGGIRYTNTNSLMPQLVHLYLDLPAFRLTGNGAGVPVFELSVSGGTLLGVPEDLRGTQGVWGGPVLDFTAAPPTAPTTRQVGGAGGAGGCGLMIVTRELIFGLNGQIITSGANGSPGNSVVWPAGTRDLRSGGGGGGAPGALLVVMDQENVAYPDLSNGHFVANHGSVTQVGTPIEHVPVANPLDTPQPWTGLDPGIGAASHWRSMSRVQWLRSELQLGDGAEDTVPTPQILSITGNDYGVVVELLAIPSQEYDTIEIWSSVDDVRANATKVYSGRGHVASISFNGIRTRYYWARAIHGARRSDWSSAANDGALGAGGSLLNRSITSTQWVETFDAYTTREDFEREWEIVEGDPIISFPENGQRGSRVLSVQGPMQAIYRRTIPYDRDRMYSAFARMRIRNSMYRLDSLGYYGVAPDGTRVSRLGSGGLGGNVSILSSVNLPDFETVDEWFAIYSYVSGSANTFQNNAGSGSPGFNGNPAGMYAPRNIAAYVSLVYGAQGCVGVRPFISVNKTDSAAICELDTLWFCELAQSSPSVTGLLDPNFSAADDNRYWVFDPADHPEISREIGGGINGANAMRWDISGAVSGNYSWIQHREAITLTSTGTITVRLTYEIDSGATVSGTSYIYVDLFPVKYDPNNYSPRNYYISASEYRISNTLGALTDDGDWHDLVVSFPNIYSSDLVGAEAFIFRVAIVSVAGDSFVMRVGRARIAQT